MIETYKSPDPSSTVVDLGGRKIVDSEQHTQPVEAFISQAQFSTKRTEDDAIEYRVMTKYSPSVNMKYLFTPAFVLPYIHTNTDGQQLSFMLLNDQSGANCFARDPNGNIQYGPIDSFDYNSHVCDYNNLTMDKEVLTVVSKATAQLANVYVSTWTTGNLLDLSIKANTQTVMYDNTSAVPSPTALGNRAIYRGLQYKSSTASDTVYEPIDARSLQ